MQERQNTMTIIPFHRSNGYSSYCLSKSDFTFSGEMVLIQNIDEKQFLDDSNDGNATYNLRAGSEYRDYLDKSITTIGDNEYIHISPGETVVIKTLEFVQFPTSRYGLILPRVTLLQRGLSTVASKVDPGYQGNLAITLFNHSRNAEVLKYGDQFCSLTLFDVGQSIRPYDKVAKSLQGGGKNWRRKAKDVYNRHLGVFFAGFVIINIIGYISSFLGLFDFLRKILGR